MRLWRFKRHVFYRCERSRFKSRFLQIVIRLNDSFKRFVVSVLPQHVWSWALRMIRKKSDREQPGVRLPMCESSPLDKHKTTCPDEGLWDVSSWVCGLWRGVDLAAQMLHLWKVKSHNIAREKSISEKCRARYLDRTVGLRSSNASLHTRTLSKTPLLFCVCV